jgi:ketosteroid isomerase-like protein
MHARKRLEIAARLAVIVLVVVIALVVVSPIRLNTMAIGPTTKNAGDGSASAISSVESVEVHAQGNPEKELLDIEDKMTAAYVSKNLAAYLQYIDPAVSAFHASNPYRIDDKQVVQDALGMFYKNSDPSGLYKLQPRVQLYGDTAVVTYHFLETGGEGPRAYAYEGKQTDVFVKKQGKWVLVHFHSSRQVRAH